MSFRIFAENGWVLEGFYANRLENAENGRGIGVFMESLGVMLENIGIRRCYGYQEMLADG